LLRLRRGALRSRTCSAAAATPPSALARLLFGCCLERCACDRCGLALRAASLLLLTRLLLARRARSLLPLLLLLRLTGSRAAAVALALLLAIAARLLAVATAFLPCRPPARALLKLTDLLLHEPPRLLVLTRAQFVPAAVRAAFPALRIRLLAA
jgi:hypothetical protein